MKTLHYVRERIAQVEGKLPSIEPINSLFPEITTPTREQKKLAKELALLTWVKILLETNPSEAYIDSELKRLLRFIKSKDEQFRYFWGANRNKMEMNEARSKYNKECGIAEAKRQVKMLRYILETDDNKNKKAKK